MVNTDDRLSSENKNAKLIGGGRPKIVKAPKLRIITSPNNYINIISTVIRSINNIWYLYDEHNKCPMKSEGNCTFCAMRSLSQRLNQQKREPSIQPHELLMQEDKIEVNCTTDMLESFFNKILQLSSEDNKEFMQNCSLNAICKHCGQAKTLYNQPLIEIKDNNQSESTEEILEKCMEAGISSLDPCCNSSRSEHTIMKNQHLLFIVFKNPRNIDPFEKCKIGEEVFLYSSHVQDNREDKCKYTAHFSYNELILHQKDEEVALSDREICLKNVKMLVLIKKIPFIKPSSISPYNKMEIYENSSKGKKRKNAYEQSEKGKKTRDSYDQSEQRKKSHESYELSDKGKKRKDIYEQSEQGEKTRDSYKYKRILSELEIDTGFNFICCSCNEFKSKTSCVNTLLRGGKESRFTEEEESAYLLKDENYNISLDGNFYVCLSCLNQIKQNKKPKRNDQELLEYYDFPEELLKEIKEKCDKEKQLENEMVLNENLRISKSLTNEYRLNKLEQFLFKNPIPFIRIANCKMGRYLKVHGNLILISSDLHGKNIATRADDNSSILKAKTTL